MNIDLWTGTCQDCGQNAELDDQDRCDRCRETRIDQGIPLFPTAVTSTGTGLYLVYSQGPVERG